MGIVGGQRAMGVRSSGERADEHGARSCDAAACRLSWQLAAHLTAARIRAVRNGSARLEALSLPIQQVGTDQSSAHDGTAIRWRARLAKLA